MFITTKVFDPALLAKAVQITGQDAAGKPWDGFYLVKGIEGRYIQLVNHFGVGHNFHMELFEDENCLKLQVLELPQQNVVEIEEEKQPKTGFNRNYISRNSRLDIQIQVDNAHVERILKENVKPMKLDEIMKRMQENHSHFHWNQSNSSGFIKHAIKCGKRIKKVERGVYAYDWEAAK